VFVQDAVAIGEEVDCLLGFEVADVAVTLEKQSEGLLYETDLELVLLALGTEYLFITLGHDVVHADGPAYTAHEEVDLLAVGRGVLADVLGEVLLVETQRSDHRHDARVLKAALHGVVCSHYVRVEDE